MKKEISETEKTEIKQLPIAVRVALLKKEVTEAIIGHELPPCVIEPVLANIYNQVAEAAAKELATEKLGGESLTITVKKKNADDTVENLVVSGGHPVEFNYDKSSGALKENYTDILISGNKDKNIIVIKETGRVLVE